jgi:hypothetical protein
MHVALLDMMDDILVESANTPLEITRGEQDVNDDNTSTPQTVARISYLSLFRRYMKLAGYGNLNELSQEFCYFYRVPVINSRRNQGLSLEVPETRLFSTRLEKYQAIIKTAHDYSNNHQTLNILTSSDKATEELVAQLHECNISFNAIRAEQDWEQADTQSININLISVTGELSSTTLPGAYLMADYVTYSGLHKLVSQVVRCNNASNDGNFYHYISVEDEKISEHRQDSALLALLWWCARQCLKNQKVGFLSRIFLNIINQIDSTQKMKKRRALLEYEIKKGKLLSFTGHNN